MKKIILTLSLLFFFLNAQDISSIGEQEQKNSFEGGLGIYTINGKSYTSFSLTPDFSFGKFGVGLNIQLLFDQKEGFSFRDDDYKHGVGYLRMINYIRYGRKDDDVFIRIGSIKNGTLGQGFLMFQYTNQANYQERKIGLQLDLDFENFGFETMYSNFGRPEVLGLRGYYRPFFYLETPVIKTLEIGVAYIHDFNKNYDVSALGVDASVKLLDLKHLKSKLYYNYGKLIDYGSGSAVGLSFVIPKIENLFEFGIKYEIRFLDKEFIPNLFSSGYELLREKYAVISTILNSKETSGHFSEIALSMMKILTVRGSYSKIHGGLGFFHASLDVPALKMFYFNADYTKTNIESFDEAFTINENSIARISFGYQINSYLFATVTYLTNWVYNEEKYDFVPQKRFIPQVKFRYQF